MFQSVFSLMIKKPQQSALGSATTSQPNEVQKWPAQLYFYVAVPVIALLLMGSVLLGILVHPSTLRPTPNLVSLQSDLIILAHNDLYGSQSSQSWSAILLSEAQTHTHAANGCHLLGETLANGFDVPFQSLLQYLVYLDKSDDLYWVAEQSDSNCTALNQAGNLVKMNCNTSLPSLCTQSAPLSDSSYHDTSPNWRITVTTGSLNLTGYRDRHSFRFEGVRYAQQSQRFEHSVVYTGPETAKVLQPASECVQAKSVGSEDCLFLNIWTPFLPLNGGTSKKLKPVMVYIHGGSFTEGSGSQSLFDGGNMASRGDVVVVTFNYRLGTLGFLALDDGQTNGNYGLVDQITALEWIAGHIADFGGDPTKITLFGQSAGASSIRALIGSPKAVNTVSAAIMQSSPAGTGFAMPYSDYYNISFASLISGQPILQATGCSGSSLPLDCLRSYPAHGFADHTTIASNIVVDGTYVPSHQLHLDGTGPAAYIPVLMGTMFDDGVIFSLAPNSSESSTSYLNFSRVATDAMFRCLNQATAAAAAKYDTFPRVWYYTLNQSYTPATWYPAYPGCAHTIYAGEPFGKPASTYQKCHSGDLLYVFGNIIREGYPPRDEDDIPFSQFMLDSWTAFGWNHDPNPDPAYLRARGYSNTTAAIAKAGTWKAVGNGTQGLTMRLLQSDSIQTSFIEMEACEALGFPMDYYG